MEMVKNFLKLAVLFAAVVAVPAQAGSILDGLEDLEEYFSRGKSAAKEYSNMIGTVEKGFRTYQKIKCGVTQEGDLGMRQCDESERVIAERYKQQAKDLQSVGGTHRQMQERRAEWNQDLWEEKNPDSYVTLEPGYRSPLDKGTASGEPDRRVQKPQRQRQADANGVVWMH